MAHTLYLVEPDPTERRRLQSVLAAAAADTVAAFESIETFLARAGALEAGQSRYAVAGLGWPRSRRNR